MQTGLLASAVLVTLAAALLWPTWVGIFCWLGRRRSAAGLRVALVLLTLAALSVGFYFAMTLGPAYEQSTRRGVPRAVREAAEAQYGKYLWVMLLACPATMVVLIRRRLRPWQAGEALSGVAGLLAPVATGALFLSTLPKEGNEGIIVLMFIIPLVIAVLLVPLFVVSIVLLVRSARHWLRTWRLGRAVRDLVCPRCGRSLAGNVSGQCEACGWAVPDEVRSVLGLLPSSAEVTGRWDWPAILVIGCDVVACVIAGVSFFRMLSGAGCAVLQARDGAYPWGPIVAASPLLEFIMAVFLWGAANGVRKHSPGGAVSCRNWAIGYMLLSVFEAVGLPLMLAGQGLTGGESVLLRWSWVDAPVLAWLIICGVIFPGFLLFWFSVPFVRSEVASWGRSPARQR